MVSRICASTSRTSRTGRKYGRKSDGVPRDTLRPWLPRSAPSACVKCAHPGLIQKRGSCQVLSEAWRDYDESVVSQQKNPKTDRCRWSIHIVDKLGHIPLDSIDSKTMQSFKNQLESSNLSPQSVKHVLALIRRVINRSIRTETWSGRNPICLIDMPRVDNKRERFLMPDEAKALLASVRRRSDQWYRIALLSLHTGMRAGEIFALDGDRVDLGNRLARVVDGKTGSRWVHLTETACRVLRESGPLVPGEPVFKSRGGQRISVVSCTFDRAVDELKLNAGISDRRARIVFHSLRHTYASWLAIEQCPHPDHIQAPRALQHHHNAAVCAPVPRSRALRSGAHRGAVQWRASAVLTRCDS